MFTKATLLWRTLPIVNSLWGHFLIANGTVLLTCVNTLRQSWHREFALLRIDPCGQAVTWNAGPPRLVYLRDPKFVLWDET
jgi:hypothetical protein